MPTLRGRDRRGCSVLWRLWPTDNADRDGRQGGTAGDLYAVGHCATGQSAGRTNAARDLEGIRADRPGVGTSAGAGPGTTVAAGRGRLETGPRGGDFVAQISAGVPGGGFVAQISAGVPGGGFVAQISAGVPGGGFVA